jgi:anaerobic magnesium-protoporphyrin IX monomethyl ester cyclase
VSFRTTLMHPPLDDPTMPYHALAYLAGHLRARGFADVGIRDINIEYVNYCLRPDRIRGFYAEADRRLALLSAKDLLSYEEQEQFYRLSAAPRFAPEDLLEDVRLFRSLTEFLDYRSYARAVRRVNGYFGLLGALSYPAEIENFMLKSRGRFSPYNLRNLLSADLAEKACFPFIRFFEDELRHDKAMQQTDLFGISVVYDHQLLHALHLARMLRRVWPGKKIVIGGTAISQLYKYLKNKQKIKLFFRHCDALVIGEGESALCEIVARRGEILGGEKIPNVLTYNHYRDELTSPELKYENVSALGPPAYDYQWDLYMSPARGINYSPTRGCYWNRCTFCDYGLNTDKPTSPWRERRIEQVVTDLKAAQEQFSTRYFYLAVDVLSPAYMDRLAGAIIQSQLQVRWSAEIRLEKAFKADRVQKISDSGAVCLSFGMESGNQRILDLIDKGTKLEYMSEAMKNFAAAGVAVQIMAFTGFPTETANEAQETRAFLRENANYWSTGGLGEFLLTGTAIIARNPEKFGIRILETRDADIARAISYTVDGETELKRSLTEEADASFDDSASLFPSIFGRPWAGGTDTLHSMIYYDHYGKDCFRQYTLDYIAEAVPELDEELLEYRIELQGCTRKSRFDMSRILENRQLFLQYVKRKLEEPAEPTYESFMEWAERAEPAAGDSEPSCWLVTLSAAVKLSNVMYDLLHLATTRNLTLRQLLAGFRPEASARVLKDIREIEKRKMLAFVAPVSGDRGERGLSTPGRGHLLAQA